MLWISLIIYFFVTTTLAQFHKFNKNSNHLVGGRNPIRGEAKYIVVVTDGDGFCGGGIIGEKFILTAAHCVKSNEQERKFLYPIKIIAGTNVVSGYTKNAVIERDVVRAYQPGPFILDGGKNDIAVLELSSPLGLLKNHHILQKLNLPEPSHDNPITYPTYEHENVKFAGYGDTHAYNVRVNGVTKFVSVGAGTLQVADAVIDDVAKCAMFIENFRADQMCLNIVEDKSKTKHQGGCSGDSGSPAVLNNNTVIGVYSLGALCDTNQAPAIFTRVSYYVPLIEKAMSGNGDGLAVYTP